MKRMTIGVALLAVFAIALSAQAANQTYRDGDSDNTWSTSTSVLNWDAGTYWTNGNSAIFGGTGETVTVSTVSAAGITINSTGYTLTGGTITSSGSITANQSATIDSAIALNANQSWTAASGKTLTLGGAMSGTSTLTYGGSGSYVLAGGNNNSGALTIDTATVTVNSGASLFAKSFNFGGLKTVTIQNSGKLVLPDWEYGTVGQTNDGANNFVIKDGGILQMDGATMNSGVNKGIQVTSGTGYFRTPNTTTWSGSYGGRDFQVSSGATLVFDGGGNFTTSRLISGSGNVKKSDGGTLTLSATNTYSGKTSITGGTLSIAADSGLGSAPGSAVADQLTINGGTLKITATGQTLAANRGVTLGASGATIDITSLGTGDTATLSGIIAGTGALTLKSSGDLSSTGGGAGGLGIKLNNSGNTFTGDVTVTSGLVSYVGNGAFGNSGNKIILNGGGLLDAGTSTALSRNVQMTGTGTFRTYGSTSVTWSGAITGSGNINRTDGGTLTLSGDLSGYGGTYDNQGGSTVLTGTAASTIGGNWKISANTLTIDSSANQALAGTISGTGALTKKNSGTLTLSTVNSFSGALTVNGGILVASASTSGGYSSATGSGGSGNTITVNSGATLQYTGSRGAGYHGANAFINGGTITFDNSDMSFASGKTITFDTAAGTINGTGQWRMRDASPKVTVTAAASGSTISVGTISLTLTGGNRAVFDVADGAAANDLTVSSNIDQYADGETLTKTGAGTLLLSGTSSYTGATTVNQGTLKIASTGSLGNTAVSVANGAALVNNGTIAGAVTTVGTGAVSGTGTFKGLATITGSLNPGNSPGYQKYEGGLSLASTATTTFELSGTSRSDLTHTGAGYYDAIDITGGTFTLDGTVNVTWLNSFEAVKGNSFRLFNWTGTTSQTFTGFDVGTDLSLPSFTTNPSLSWDTSSFLSNGTITVIPEPGTVGIVATFLAAALLRKRRFG